MTLDRFSRTGEGDTVGYVPMTLRTLNGADEKYMKMGCSRAVIGCSHAPL